MKDEIKLTKGEIAALKFMGQHKSAVLYIMPIEGYAFFGGAISLRDNPSVRSDTARNLEKKGMLIDKDWRMSGAKYVLTKLGKTTAKKLLKEKK